MAFVFSILTLATVISKANSVCVESISSEKNSAFSSVNQVELKQNNHSESTENAEEAHACKSACYICHLGHCDFALTSPLQFKAISILKNKNSMLLALVIYDFHSGLFRPPISNV